MRDGLTSAFFYAGVLVVGAILTFFFVRWMARVRGTAVPAIGSLRTLGAGAAAGLGASLGSGALYYLTKRPAIASPLWPALKPSRFIGNLGPAAIEEVGFRGGVVQVCASAWGSTAGLLAGSIP